MMLLFSALALFFSPYQVTTVMSVSAPLVQESTVVTSSPETTQLNDVAAVMEKKLPLWANLWRKTVPGFSVLSLKKISEEKIVPDMEDTIDDTATDNSSEDKLYEMLRVYSPDKTKYVDPHGNIELSEENGKISAGFDVDSEVSLTDLKNKTWKRLLFCGTACGFDDAAWLNNNVFVVVGESEYYGENNQDTCGDENNPCPYVATLHVFDLVKNTVTLYYGPPTKKEVQGYLHLRFPQLNFD